MASKIDTLTPYTKASIGGVELPLLDVGFGSSRYSRGQMGALSLPSGLSKLPTAIDEVTAIQSRLLGTPKSQIDLFDQGAQLGMPDTPVPAFLPVDIESGYKGGGPIAKIRLFTAEQQYSTERVSLVDRWGVWGSKRLRFMGSFTKVGLNTVLNSLASKGGATLDSRTWIEIKKRLDVFAEEPLSALIEGLFRDWGVTPISYFGPDGVWYVGKDRSASQIVMTYFEGQHFLAPLQLAERTIRYDYAEISQSDKTTCGERYDKTHVERTIPYIKATVIYTPWIYAGDRVNLSHSWLPLGLGTYRVATATHRTNPPQTYLECEAFNPFEPEAEK